MPDRIRALYVDDEPGLLEVARLFLEQSPEFSVVTAESAQAALDSPAIATCDAIISDYQMPGMDGIAFLKAVRKKYGDMPFILFTGRGREEVVIEAINNGADFYIQKGGDPTAQFAELAHKIRQAVSRKRSQDELKAAYEQITASDEELRDQYEELAQGEKRVRESQELLRTFLDSATDAFTIWDADLNLVDMNRVALSYLPPGTKKEDITGRNLQEYLSGEGEWRSIDRYREVLRTGVPFTGTEKPAGLPHDNRWLNIKCFRVGDGLGIMTTDVTREKEAEEKLRTAYEKLSASEEELRHQYEEITAAQQKLVESREQMAEIADTVPGVVYQSLFRPGEKEEFTFLSSRVPEVFGISAEREGFTDRFFACLDPPDRELLARSIREAVANGAPWEFEGRFTKPSGETIWFQGLARPVQKVSGLYYNGVLLDITSRKRAEEAVIEHAAKLREAQEMAHLGFWNWDIRTGNVEWSEEVYHIFGLDPATFCPTIDSILARSPWPEEQNRAKELIRKATESHRPGSYEQRFIRPDNSVGYYYSTFQGRYDETGTLASIVGTVLDITTRKQFEDALQQSRAELSAILEGTPVLQFVIGRDHRIIAWNKALEKYSGVPAAEVVGTDLQWRAFYKEKRPVLADLLIDNDTNALSGWYGGKLNPAPHVAGGYEATDFFPAMGPSGTWLMFTAAPIRDSDGTVIGAVETLDDVTERVRATEELRASEERLRLFIQQAPVSIALFDTKMRYLAASRRWMADYNLGDRDIIGRSHYEIFPEISEDIRAIHRQGLAGEVISSAEDRFVRSNGSVQWLAWEVRPWYTTGNAIGGIIIYSEDITTRKEMEEELRESEEKYRSLVDVSPVAVAVHRDGKVIYVNPEAVRLLKAVRAEDLIGKAVLPFIHPDYHEKALEDFRRMADDGRMIPLQEEVLLAATGEPFTVEVVAKPIRYEGVPSVFVAFRDITERKKMEVALRESEEKYRNLVENATEAIFILQDRRMIYANPRMGELLGVPAANLLEYSFLDYVWPADRALVLDRYTRRMAGEDVLTNYDFRMTGPEGKLLWVHISIAKVTWQQKPATLNLLTDITERKRAETALQEAWRKLALLNSLTRHDIRNQLIALQGFTQFAKKKEQDPAIAGFLEKIDSCATMIRGQIEFMKTYHELGMNSPSWYLLDTVVSKACIRELPCRNHCSKTEVFADPMLEKVFFNLFDNAHRHGEHATEAVVRCEITGDDLIIIVEDNGIGIPDNEKEKIFGKGYGKNTGFGLFLAKEILSITGITIRETGTPGKGARFEIHVPRECWRREGA